MLRMENDKHAEINIALSTYLLIKTKSKNAQATNKRGLPLSRTKLMNWTESIGSSFRTMNNCDAIWPIAKST